jgi:putative NADH-flavin reductase
LNGLLNSTTGFEVTALVRAGSTSKIPQEGHAALKVVRGDFGDDSFLKSSLAGQDALVVSLDVNPASLELQNRLVDIAVAVGVKRVIPSEFGSVSINLEGHSEVVKV